MKGEKQCRQLEKPKSTSTFVQQMITSMKTNPDRAMFAERLKRMRTQKGLSQGEVARHFGMSAVGYGGWERGDSEPSIENLVKLCRLFGCSSDSLVGLADMPAPPDLDGIKKNAKAVQSAIASLLGSLDSLR